jgi:hypothetical protein
MNEPLGTEARPIPTALPDIQCNCSPKAAPAKHLNAFPKPGPSQFLIDSGPIRIAYKSNPPIKISVSNRRKKGTFSLRIDRISNNGILELEIDLSPAFTAKLSFLIATKQGAKRKPAQL